MHRYITYYTTSVCSVFMSFPPRAHCIVVIYLCNFSCIRYMINIIMYFPIWDNWIVYRFHNITLLIIAHSLCVRKVIHSQQSRKQRRQPIFHCMSPCQFSQIFEMAILRFSRTNGNSVVVAHYIFQVVVGTNIKSLKCL